MGFLLLVRVVRAVSASADKLASDRYAVASVKITYIAVTG